LKFPPLRFEHYEAAYRAYSWGVGLLGYGVGFALCERVEREGGAVEKEEEAIFKVGEVDVGLLIRMREEFDGLNGLEVSVATEMFFCAVLHMGCGAKVAEGMGG
jgi:hypothetical protein